MNDFAGWLPDDERAEAPSSAPAPGNWLPPRIARAIVNETITDSKQERAAKKAREAKAEVARDRAVAAFMTDQASRGEPVSPLDAVTGELGYTVGEAIERHQELADRVPAHQRPERDYELLVDGDPVIHASRSRGDGWPGSGYETDSLVARAEDNHRWLVAYVARHRYPEAEAAARAKTARPDVSRSRHSGYASHGEITRVVTPDGNAGWS